MLSKDCQAIRLTAFDRRAEHEQELEAALLRYLAAARDTSTATTNSHANGIADDTSTQDTSHPDVAQDQSVTSDEDVRNSLLPPQASNRQASNSGSSSYQPHRDGPLETMLREIAKLTRATVKACEDKVALAAIAYDTVSHPRTL